MEQGASHDRLGKIQAPAAIGVQSRSKRQNVAIVIKPGFEAGEERMPFARERHVKSAGQPDAHRPLRLPSPQGGHGGPKTGLRFLATEGAAHSQALHANHVPRQTKHPRDDFLCLTRVLGGRMRANAAGLIDPRQGVLRFKVKVFLAAHGDLAIDAMRAARQGGGRISTPQANGRTEERLSSDCLLDGEYGRAGLGNHPYPGSSAPGRIQSFAQHPYQGLLMISKLARKQRLIVPAGAAIAFSRNIIRGEDRGHARFCQGGAEVQREHDTVRRGRHNRPGVERSREAGRQVVGVKRKPADVTTRAFVGDQAACSKVSQANFSTRDLARANRYSAEPR